MHSFPNEEKIFLLPGPVGSIEVWTAPAPAEKARGLTAIICHPHPLYGGTMTHKVVTILAKACQEKGIKTIRFNFRGVGQSEGSFDEGMGETEDLVCIANWLHSVNPNDQLILAGFSFGGYVAALASTQIPVIQLISVAPQVSRFYEPSFPKIETPWYIIQGDKDEVISTEEVYQWVTIADPPPTLIKIADASHFFHGKLVELREKVSEVLV